MVGTNASSVSPSPTVPSAIVTARRGPRRSGSVAPKIRTSNDVNE